MKKTRPTLDEIRKGMTPLQKELLQEIWQHFQTTGDWPTVRRLFSNHDKQKVKKALSPLGASVGREDRGSTRWSKYQLSLLGALLTKDGVAFQRLLERFFKFQRNLFKNEPHKDFSTAKEIETALGLKPEETALLGQLLSLAHVGGASKGDWGVGAMDEAENFPKGSLSPQVEDWVFRYYHPGAVVFSEDQHSPSQRLPSYVGLPFSPGLIAPSAEPHPPEIALSLERLHNKYPDASKLGFLVMRFSDGKPFQRIVSAIKHTAEKHGIVVVRADENQFHADLLGNVRTLLHGCSFGIAVYERIDTNEPNANVGLEVGYLMAMNKPVLLLKDKTVPELPADLGGKLYKLFDPHEPEKTIPEQLTNWLADNGIIVSKG